MSNFPFCHNVFKKLSASCRDMSESVNLWERVKLMKGKELNKWFMAMVNLESAPENNMTHNSTLFPYVDCFQMPSAADDF